MNGCPNLFPLGLEYHSFSNKKYHWNYTEYLYSSLRLKLKKQITMIVYN